MKWKFAAPQVSNFFFRPVFGWSKNAIYNISKKSKRERKKRRTYKVVRSLSLFSLSFSLSSPSLFLSLLSLSLSLSLSLCPSLVFQKMQPASHLLPYKCDPKWRWAEIIEWDSRKKRKTGFFLCLRQRKEEVWFALSDFFFVLAAQPNQQRTRNKLPTELRCRNFVNMCRLSIQVGAECAKTCVQCVRIPTELPF